jgi:hypothetical protein
LSFDVHAAAEWMCFKSNNLATQTAKTIANKNQMFYKKKFNLKFGLQNQSIVTRHMKKLLQKITTFKFIV